MDSRTLENWKKVKQALEKAGKSGSMSMASELLDELTQEIRRLESFAGTQTA